MALILTLTATAVWVSAHGSTEQIAAQATVTASSTDPLFSARDAVGSGSAEAPGAGWVSDRQTVGAWIELTWPAVHTVQQITLVRNPLDQPGVTQGYLTFGDGSHLFVPLSTTSRQTTVTVGPRAVLSMRFTASHVTAGATDVIISEITVAAGTDSAAATSGDLATTAFVTSSAGDPDARAIVGGDGSADPNGARQGWTAPSAPGAWVQLDWTTPQELTTIQVAGAAGSTRTIHEGTLVFSDGSRLPLGAVTADPSRPTTVSFMPRTTSSVRLIIDESDGSADLVLAAMRAYGRGATPPRFSPAPAASPGDATVTAPNCHDEDEVAHPPQLQIRCPVMGSTATGDVTMSVIAPAGYTSVSAVVWPSDVDASEGAVVETALDHTGAGTVGFPLDDLPRGPFTVHFRAVGEGQPSTDVNFQLYRTPNASAPVPSSTAAAGRTLTFDEEFDGPISISRTGADAEFAAAKPVVGGAEDFGDAIFGDPENDDNLRVIDNSYLRIGVTPLKSDSEDPQGWGRNHVGGLLASARVGGSGFSAQYGYFETRMAVPAAPGTWPAFWMLPTDNLVADQDVVAEIDAVEMYGHDPISTCQTTHQYESTPDTTGVAACGQRFASERQALQWHTYGVAILPDTNLFYIDGVQVASAPQVRGADSPMFFLVDLALGGGWPVDLSGVQNRASLYVDYVRVYV